MSKIYELADRLVGQYLREKKPEVKLVAVEPADSPVLSPLRDAFADRWNKAP